MSGVAHTEEDEVRSIDGVADLFLGEEVEVFGDLASARSDFDVAQNLRREASAERWGFDANRKGFDGSPCWSRCRFQGGEWEVVDGGGFAGYAVVVHGVDAVGGDVHLEERAVVGAEGVDAFDGDAAEGEVVG